MNVIEKPSPIKDLKAQMDNAPIQIMRTRFIPVISNIPVRTVLGFMVLLGSIWITEKWLGMPIPWAGAAAFLIGWGVSVFFTDKYRHKYPQRYVTYVLASHFKAALVMAFVVGAGWLILPAGQVPVSLIWGAFGLFSLVDMSLSLLHRKNNAPLSPIDLHSPTGTAPLSLLSINTTLVVEQLSALTAGPFAAFLKNALPEQAGTLSRIKVCDDLTDKTATDIHHDMALVIGRGRLNDVRRLNLYLQHVAQQIAMGGFFAVSYTPLDYVMEDLKKRYPGFLYGPVALAHYLWYRAFPKIPWIDSLYFLGKKSWIDNAFLKITKRRNRLLSKAEVWGRLAFWGMNVVKESPLENGEVVVLAQRVSLPVHNRQPSYYPVVALEKLGLNGEIVRMHKVRTMFPFSEFMQKRIFEDNGLAATGKFANDFRLTGLGKFLRKYWLDEVPQIFDWLRGDIKLVGIRATSRHFLSLYPAHFLELYWQVKPGLVPPLFDENTRGFDQIVAVEMKYLESYLRQPLLTDFRYLNQTLIDIFFRGIRSK